MYSKNSDMYSKTAWT